MFSIRSILTYKNSFEKIHAGEIFVEDFAPTLAVASKTLPCELKLKNTLLQ